MTIRFPNASRFYDATRGAVHFWGYDQSMETSFFITAAALQHLAPDTSLREAALLAVFDSNRARIYEAATRVYGHGHVGVFSYDLTPSNL
jgi:Protein of unknown function (DUF1488)